MPLRLPLEGGVLFFPSTSLWSQQAQSTLIWTPWDLGARSHWDFRYSNALLKCYSGLKWDKKVLGSGFKSSFTCLLFCLSLKIQYWSRGTAGLLSIYLFIYFKLLLALAQLCGFGFFLTENISGQHLMQIMGKEQNKNDSFLMFRNISSQTRSFQYFFHRSCPVDFNAWQTQRWEQLKSAETQVPGCTPCNSSLHVRSELGF